jgi:kumamolisin
MRLLKTSTLLVSMTSVAPVLAQQVDFRTNAVIQTLGDGSRLITPSSSIPKPGTGLANTNLHVLEPAGGTPTPPKPGGVATTPTPFGVLGETPASIACVYGLVKPVTGCNPLSVVTNASGGANVIAIVDAYNAPNAAADLAYFSTYFGLPTANFQVVYANASGVQDTPPPYDAGWELEISLDIQWAHAMAPSAKILLVEANSNSIGDLFGAVQVASNLVALGGGGEQSHSWATGEFSGESSYDTYFTKTGVVYFAGCGDSPGTYYPCASPNVIGVGGTSISRDPVTGDFVGDATWSLAGGGPSQYESRPAYQSTISKIVGSARGTPDLSAVANPYTPVFFYVSDLGGWYLGGGVSVATPVVAGITNFIGAFRTSTNAELTYAYKNQNKYIDIVQGYCGPYAGYWADRGWDYCSGIGSPVAKYEQNRTDWR